MENQFYGLTDNGDIVELPKAEYSSSALTQYQESGGIEKLEMIFTEDQYRVILSHVEAELNDWNGDKLIPTYMVISFATQLPIFPHASVDTRAELDEFIRTHPMELTAGIELTDVRDKWPKLAEEPVVEATNIQEAP